MRISGFFLIPSLSTGFQPSIFEKLFLASNGITCHQNVCLPVYISGLEETSIKQIVTYDVLAPTLLLFQHCASSHQ